MAVDCDVSVITVNGEVEHPLAAPTMAIRVRSVRLDLSGVAATGTLLLPTLVYTAK